MNETEVIEICRQAILVMLYVSGPLLVLSLVVGLIVSLFQTITQIQEQTLTFLPKLVLTFGALVLLMPFMYTQLATFTQAMADRMIGLGAP